MTTRENILYADTSAANAVDLCLVVVSLIISFFLCWKLWKPVVSLLKWVCYLALLMLFVSVGIAIFYPDGFSLMRSFADEHKYHFEESVALDLARSVIYDVFRNLHRAYKNAKGMPTPPSQ